MMRWDQTLANAYNGWELEDYVANNGESHAYGKKEGAHVVSFGT